VESSKSEVQWWKVTPWPNLVQNKLGAKQEHLTSGELLFTRELATLLHNPTLPSRSWFFTVEQAMDLLTLIGSYLTNHSTSSQFSHTAAQKASSPKIGEEHGDANIAKQIYHQITLHLLFFQIQRSWHVS
jgi:hypothetical protein